MHPGTAEHAPVARPRPGPCARTWPHGRSIHGWDVPSYQYRARSLMHSDTNADAVYSVSATIATPDIRGFKDDIEGRGMTYQ